MKFFKTLGTLALAATLFFALPAMAQMGGGGHSGGGHRGGGGNSDGGYMGGNHNNEGHERGDMCNGGWNVHPDSLEIVTVNGVVIIDSSMGMNGMFFLDEDGDGQADFRLNFGPYWYTPDSSDAQRPADGETVAITGGAHADEQFDMPVVIVYEINGEFWRDPYTPFWNNMGGGFHHGGRDGDNWHGGMMNDSLETVSISGVVLVDSTLMPHYYLDEDADGVVDYFLNFGPPWYEPESGAVRPQDGDEVTIVGGLHDGMDEMETPVVIVYEINGLVWRDSTAFGAHAGGWIGKNMRQNKRIHNPFDRNDWMEINPGWNSGGNHHGGGMMTPDSLWCQLLEIYPENIPGGHDRPTFAAFQIDMFTPDGMSQMRRGGRMGHMSFNNQVRFQFHYNDEQMTDYDEDSLTAFVWDDQSDNWQPVADAVVDVENNTVTFSSEDVNSYVILSTSRTTNIAGEASVIGNFSLKQNYPNPFNPTTTIEFALEQDNMVTLNIYNVIGQQVATLVSGPMTAGVHQVQFDGQNLNSGVYFYELRVGATNKIRRMNLIK